MNEKQLAVLANELTLPAYNEALAARNYAAVADSLNARAEVPNPTPRLNVNLRFTWDTFIGLLTAQEILGLYGYGNFASDLRRSLETNARVEMLALWRGAKTALSAATVTKVEAEFAKTQLDPDWTATILQPSRAMVLGLPVVEASDVELVDQRLHGR